MSGSDPIRSLNEALSGRYRIERELGEGGMATVYLAHDIRHERRVAIKVLRPELAAVVGAERFLAEIRTTAQLQHPHILTLHDSGEADGFLFYVMPYVQGESLRERLARERQLPVDEAVALARKVADALDYAHERGVVHRDVKPANVLLSERGEPLVADFGIALAVSEAGEGRITETGLSLGTPHYMSPEQASGDQSVDRRTDVYALGCVLHEMLVGEPPHGGSTAQAVLARILTGEPQRVRDVRPTVPPNVDAAVARALEKLPADRFGGAAAFAEALEDPGFRYARAEADTPETMEQPETPSRRWAVLGALGAVVVTLVLVFFLGRGTAPEPDRAVTRFHVNVPEGILNLSACCGPSEALSPDGEWLVFVGSTGSERSLYLRRRGDLDAEPIPGTRGASIPFFSPDGRWIGFHADGRLRKISLAGGPAVPITDVETPIGWSWGDDDVIVYAIRDDAVYTVPAAGGDPTPVPGTQGAGYLLPWTLPGGGAALVRANEPNEDNENARVVTLDLDTGEADTLSFATRAAYASGHLVLSTADGTLLAQPFDPDDRRTTGPAVAILEGVSTANPAAIGEFAVSRNGGLVYQTGAIALNETLIIHDQAGPTEIALPEPGNYEDPTFSPDGRRIAVTLGVADFGQIWIWDRDQRTQHLLTADGGGNMRPVWTPDGSRIAFARRTVGTPSRIYWRNSDGSGQTEQLLELDGEAFPVGFASDGGSLVFTARSPAGDWNVGLLDLHEDTVRWLVETSADDYQGQISPDGRWLAYTSKLSGRPEVYVQPLDGPGGRTQVSGGGGHSPRWAPDGGTVYYATSEGAPVIAASVTAEENRFRVLTRADAFEGPDDFNVQGTGTTTWDVSPDGEEFLYIGRDEFGGGQGFVWVLNWPELIPEAASAGGS